jgi:hypothetical protein
MRTSQEILSELAEAQKEFEEAKQQYAAFIAPGKKARPISIKEVRPVHDKLARARDLVKSLEKELRRIERRSLEE